jgi:hypothetical protein
MKKILIAAAVALCFAGNSFAQENTGGDTAFNSASGDVEKSKVAAGVVGLAIAGAIIANNRGSAKKVIIDPPVECGPGEELVDGECVPISTTTTVTTTVTGTVTNTMTTPVTVSATTTLE